MGAVFDDISKQYLWNELLNDNCSVSFTDIGCWWGTNKKTGQQEEIDTIVVQDRTTALFGECKWTNKKIMDLCMQLVQSQKMTRHKGWKVRKCHIWVTMCLHIRLLA